MPFPSNPLPPVPADTERAAGAAFGKGNLYLTIGDRVGRLFADVNLSSLGRQGYMPLALLARLILVTVLQALEGLPDQQASAAMRSRIDWKYALHLPLDYPGLNPQVMCHLRQRLLFDAAGQQVLQRVLDHLAAQGVLEAGDQRKTDAASVLATVCALDRLERASRAMTLALESIAVRCPEWLRVNTLPHWYRRYDQKSSILRQPHSQETWDELARDIGSDGQYLLDAIATSAGLDLDTLPEIRALRQEWRRQYELSNGEILWQPAHCAGCGVSDASDVSDVSGASTDEIANAGTRQAARDGR